MEPLQYPKSSIPCDLPAGAASGVFSNGVMEKWRLDQSCPRAIITPGGLAEGGEKGDKTTRTPKIPADIN